MPDRIWLEIDLGALRRNYRTLARSISPAALFPVIKADAYNLGAVEVARTLCDYAPTFCVATPAEALQIISAGMALAHVHPRDAQDPLRTVCLAFWVADRFISKAKEGGE